MLQHFQAFLTKSILQTDLIGKSVVRSTKGWPHRTRSPPLFACEHDIGAEPPRFGACLERIQSVFRAYSKRVRRVFGACLEECTDESDCAGVGIAETCCCFSRVDDWHLKAEAY